MAPSETKSSHNLWWKVFGILALYSLTSSAQVPVEYLHMTILTGGQTTGGGQYQCFSTGPGAETSFEFGRTAPIPTDSPPGTAYLHRDPQNGNPMIVSSGLGFGPFYCRGSKQGFETTTISTFFIRNDAKFTPSDSVFTRTVNVGDSGVVITMLKDDNPTHDDSYIRWRKDGGDFIDSAQGSLRFTFHDPIQSSDGGIYEIHYYGERSSNRGGLYRLIVRGCAPGKWGPSNCNGICDNCYNGGVCDDKTGRCICPNNFKGPNCLTICRSDGGNRLGLDCEYKCYPDRDLPTDCNYLMFCLPDPFGCTCTARVKGLACNTICDGGEYGAGCRQRCHCQGGVACNRYSGLCNDAGCADGWSGENCQIPDTCTDDYYGPSCTEKCHCLDDAACDKTTGQCPGMSCAAGYEVYAGQVNCSECQGPYYGLNCAQPCRDDRCDVSACNKVTGTCHGNCFPNWLLPDCEQGIQSVTSNPVNPYQSSSFTCLLVGGSLTTESDVRLYHYDNMLADSMGITQVSSTKVNHALLVVFEVTSVAPGIYVCGLYQGSQDVTLEVNSTTYVLPVVSSPPGTYGVTSNTIGLQWTAWNADGNGIGDPPLVGYTIYQSLLRTGQSEEMTIGPEETSMILNDLQPDTDYQFSIAAVKEGAGGTGPRSPLTNASTLCEKPSNAPSVIEATAENPKELQLTWNNPTDSGACRSGIERYTIHYSSATGTFQKIIEDTSITSYTLEDIDTFTEYTISMTSSNKDAESRRSESLIVKTREENAPPPENVDVVGTFENSLDISWTAAMPYNLNGVIREYQIRNMTISDDVNVTANIVQVAPTAAVEKFSLTGLTTNTMYSIEVRTINGAGEGQWSLPVYATTGVTATGAPLAAIAGGVVVGILILILIPFLVVIILRRRSNQPKDEVGVTYEASKQREKIEGFDNTGMDDEELQTQPQSPKSMKGKPGPKPPITQPKPVAVVPLVTQDDVDGTIYENTTIPGPIRVADLHTYYEGAGSKTKAAKEYELLNKEQRYPWKVASKEEFKKRNRFRNVIPYDHTRVVLEKINDDPLSDYYNASYLKDYKGNRCYIASQAPNAASIGDFFRMIWQENISTIVMVTNYVEAGKDKCRHYFPAEIKSAEKFGDFTLLLTDETHFSDHVVRKIVITKTKPESTYEVDELSERTITHFHYVSWPDMGVPQLYATLIEFINVVKEHQSAILRKGHNEPMLVHCSAGVGRTGTFLTLYNMLDMMRETGRVDVFGYVDRMREDRIQMVQTVHQYAFIYNVLYEAYLTGDTAIPVSEFNERYTQLSTVPARTRKSLLQVEFENLAKLTPEPSSSSLAGGRSRENAQKNRFPDILPMDRRRPHLMSKGDSNSTGYINASFTDTFRKRDAFLVAQAPLPSTVLDIWRMIIDWQCPVIVMLNQHDPHDQTCAQYWPEGERLKVGESMVSMSDEELTSSYTKRTFTVSGNGQSLSVAQFQYHGWQASQQRPDSTGDFLQLIEEVDYSAKRAKAKGPIVVHCMNGLSRSGVFCTLWSALSKVRQSEKVDIFQAVKRLRAGRTNIVDSLEMYKLCYDVISDHLQGSVEYANLDAF